MLVKTGKIGDFSFLITGSKMNVILMISHHHKVVESQDNMSLDEALRYIDAFISKH